MAPTALLCSVPVAVVGGVLMHRMRERSITRAVTVLVLVPLVAALAGIIGVSGFMYTPMLASTLVLCAVVAAVSVPTAVVLGRGIARDLTWLHEAREAERAAERRSEESRRSRRHTSRPPRRGSIRSSTTTSGTRSATARSAASPSPATSTR